MALVTLAAVRNDLLEPGSEGISLEPGIHLRVGFERELGFPRGGFTLERRFWFAPGQPGSWAVIKTLTLPIHHATNYPANGAAFPSEAEESRLRVERFPTGDQLTHLRSRHADITTHLQALVVPVPGVGMVDKTFGGTTTTDTVQLRSLDGFLVASADPWFARILGLTHYDPQPSWVDAEYRVTARWSIPAETAYPDRQLDLRQVRRDGMTLDGRLTIGAVQLSSSRRVQHLVPGEEGASDYLIRLGSASGTPRPGVRLQFPRPVKRVTLTLTHSGGGAAPTWLAKAHNGAASTTPTVTTGTPLVIQASESFTILELFDTAAANDGASWEVLGISYRTGTATVGDVLSAPVRLPPGASSRPKRLSIDSVRSLPTRPAVPIAEPMTNASRLEVGATADAKLDDILRPTRVGFAMTSMQNARGWWTLSDSIRDEVTGTAGTPPAGAPFQTSFAAGSTAAPEPRALQLTGSGAAASVAYRADLNSLGQAATLTAWVHGTGGGTTAFPCIIGNDYQIGYALCVEASTRRLRFSIAGVSCFSLSTVTWNRWEHVAVVYNGATATFFINGRAGTPVAFARGSIPSNTNQPLGIGADPGVTGGDSSLLTFQGQISEVTIHARVWSATEVAQLSRREMVRPVDELKPLANFVDRPMAFLPLAGDVLDRLSPVAPTTVGTVSWVAPSSGAPRTVLSLAGTGFIQLSSRPDLQDLGSGFVLQLWVRPDAGQSFPTLIGNSYASSFWLGLDSTNYFPRLWLNGQVHVATTGLTAAVWSHVAVSYDGATIRFYVNGAAAGSLVAPAAPVAANGAGTLCIGADSGSTSGSLLFPYRGQLADVNITKRWPQRVPIERPKTLFTEFRLDGSPEDNTSEITAAAVPSPSYLVGSAEAAAEKALAFDGTRYLSFATAARPVIATAVSVQAWVRPDASSVGAQTITGAGVGASTGWWVGLEASTYRLRFERHGVGWNSASPVPANRWSHVAISYDGRSITFFINGRRDIENTITAGQGGALNTAASFVNVAADAGSAPGTLIRPYRGRISGLRVWNAPLVPATPRAIPYDPIAVRLDLDGELVDLSKGTVFAPRGATAWAVGRLDSDTRRSLSLSGAGYIEANNRLDVEPPSVRGSIEAVVRLDDSSGGIVVDDGGVMRLQIEATTRRIIARMGATAYTFTTALTVGLYHRILVSFDGVNVRSYLDGGSASAFASTLTRASNPMGRIVVGAGSTSTPGTPATAFKGQISEVTIFRDAVSPAEAAALVRDMQPGAEQIADGLDDRTWCLRARGTDGFGRTSLVGPARITTVKDLSPPPTPLAVRAAPQALEGFVTVEPGGTLRVAVSPPNPVPDLSRHLVTVRRNGPPGGNVLRERFAIGLASAASGELRLELEPRALAKLSPANGDFARVDADVRLQVGWEWPGVNRVLAPRTREFRVYRRLGHPDVIRGQITSPASPHPSRVDRFTLATNLTLAAGDLAPGRPVQIGVRIFRAVSSTLGANASITVDYEARPVVSPGWTDDVVIVKAGGASALGAPTGYPGGRVAIVPLPAAAILRTSTSFNVSDISADAAAYDDLRSRRPALPPMADWVGRLYRMTINGVTIPAAFQAAANPNTFVPGALHAIDTTASIVAWGLFPTVWHAYDAPTSSLKVWFAPRGKAAEVSLVTALAHPRLYLGSRFDTQLDATPPNATERTRVWTIGVSAADDRADQPDILGDPARYGLESAVGGPSDTAAVYRAAPQRPTAPVVVSVTPADFHGIARAQVTWAPALGASNYRLLRAADTAVHQRDAEQRRARIGAYSGEGAPPPASQVLGSDFAAWCAARFPTFDPADVFVPAGSPNYSAASEVWRAWAARFYASIDREDVPSQLAALADREGNGVVFVPVTSAPTLGTTYMDAYPGFASNRFVYRLAAASETQAAALDLSPTSEPTPRAARTPLRAPQLSRLYGGDRSMRVEWVLDSDPNVRGYRVFRGESIDELTDLRLRAGEDARLVATLQDPQLRTVKDYIRVGPGAFLKAAVRVYRRDEFVWPIPLSGVRPYDYFGGGSIEEDPDGVTLRLPSFSGDGGPIPVPPGTAVVVVYEDALGDERILGAENPLPHVDEGLSGMTDYYYRIQAYDDLGNFSPGSNILFSRAFDYSDANPAEFTRCERVVGDPANSIRVEWEAPYGSRCIVMRSTDADPTWRPVTEWTPSPPGSPTSAELAPFTFLDEEAPPNTAYSYRIRVQNRSGNTNKEYRVATVQTP